MNSYIKDIYMKIVDQSKKKFFFDVLFVPKKNRINDRGFSTQFNNCIVVHEKKKFNDKDITLLISIYLKDLELLCFEIGEAESRIPKKMRKLTENFYGRLYSYSIQFDKIFEKKGL